MLEVDYMSDNWPFNITVLHCYIGMLVHMLQVGMMLHCYIGMLVHMLA